MQTDNLITYASLQQELQHKINNKTKPAGSLGRLEEIALRIGLIQKTTSPQVHRPHIVVFAADHGIAKTGLVNPYPQAVTAQMVLNFINGGAAINVFCNQHRIHLQVVNAGMNGDFSKIQSPQFMDASMGYGTENFLDKPAMTMQQADESIQRGKQIVETIYNFGCNCIGFGEMGIGNTSSAALIMSAVTGLPIEECVGRGTGADDEQLKRKKLTLREVFDRHFNKPVREPRNILSKVGGFEIAMMTGAFLKAAALNMVIVVDGFISTAALLLANQVSDKILDYCFFAHTSGEQGHEKMLRFLQAEPLLNLGMRLGEGTGAALAIPLLQSAVNFLNEMASFKSAGVSDKK